LLYLASQYHSFLRNQRHHPVYTPVQQVEQVALLKHLNGPDIDTYLNFGLDFMTNPDNLEVPSRRERKTLMVRSLLNVQPPQLEWDEAKTEDESGVISLFQNKYC
jgi:hypothetical protein